MSPFNRSEYTFDPTQAVLSVFSGRTSNHCTSIVNEGIHAFIDKKEAFELKRKLIEANVEVVKAYGESAKISYHNPQVFEIKCSKDDIIAVGTCSIANISGSDSIYQSVVMMQGDVTLKPITEDVEVCA